MNPGHAIGMSSGSAASGFGESVTNDNRHIINAAPHDQGFGDANGNAVHVGAHLFVHAQDGGIGLVPTRNRAVTIVWSSCVLE